MIRLNIICSLIITISLVMCGCQQEIKNNVSQSAKNPLLKNIESKVKEEISVIYRSTDLGRTWSSFDNGILQNSTLSGIKQDSNRIYISTDYNGIYWSIDGQNNWRSLNSDQLKNMDINCIEVENNNIVIGTLKHGIWVSDNSGITWRESNTNMQRIPIRAFIKSKGILLAGTDSGIYQSTDKGNNWTHLFGNMQILGFTSLNNKIYAATQNGVLLNNLKFSNWKYIYKGDALHDIANDGKYIYAMTIGKQLLKTQNDGKLWENAQNGITQPANYYTNEIKNIGNDVFSAQWIGIYYSSNNGSNWKKLSGLPDSTAFSTLEITDYGILAGISIR